MARIILKLFLSLLFISGLYAQSGINHSTDSEKDLRSVALKAKNRVLKPDEFLYLLNELNKRKDYTHIEELFGRQLALTPSKRSVYVFMAKHYCERKMYKKAVKHLQLAYKHGFCGEKYLEQHFKAMQNLPAFQRLVLKIKRDNENLTRKYGFKQYKVADGLSHMNVWSFFQDENGLLWIGTEAGLNKYDGYQFESYSPANGMDYAYITEIARDKKGHLQLLTWHEGLVGFDGKSFTQYTEKDGFPAEGGYGMMLKDTAGNLIIGTMNGITIFDGQSFRNFGEEHGLSGKKVISLMAVDSGYWVGTYNGIYHFDGEKFFPVFSKENGLPGNRINKMLKTRDGKIFIATYKGLACYEKGQFHYYTTADGLLSNKVKDLIIDKQGDLWIMTYGGGLNIMKGKKIYTLNIPSSSDFPLCITQDKYNNIWVGYFVGSVYKISPREFLATDSHLNRKIERVFPSFHKTPFFLTSEFDIVDYQGNFLFNLSKVAQNNNPEIRYAYQDRNNRFWIGLTDGPVILYENGMAKILHGDYEQLKGRGVNSIADDSKGNVWLNVWNAGVVKYSNGKQEVFTETNGLHNEKCKGVAIDSYDSLWVVYDGNHYSVSDGKNFKHFTTEGLEGKNQFWNVYIDAVDDVWMGTWANGVVHFDRTNFKRYNTTNGLGSNSIGRVRKDLFENYWISSYGGTVTKKTGDEFIVYNDAHGFPANAVHNQVVVAHDSIVWFSPHFKENTQVIKFDMTSMDTFPPDIVLKHIQVNKKKYSINELPGKLPYDKNNIRFMYAGINFRSEGLIEYKVKLEGFDDQWSEYTNQTLAKYTNLPPGQYTFKVRARNQHGIWSKINNQTRFIITPPFWKTTWFLILVIIAGLLVVIGIIRFREQKLKKDKIKLERIVTERTAEIIQQKEEIKAQRDDIFQKNTMLQQKNEEINIKNEKIGIQRDELIRQRDDITASITYAKRIQEAVLPSGEYLDNIIPEYFVLFKPRDIVSGDFYWAKKVDKFVVIAAADCTGHGVPGAFMSMLGVSFLNEIVTKARFDTAGQFLNRLRKKVKKALNQEGKQLEQKDGMDMALLVWDTELNEVQYSGAYNSLYIIRSINNDNFPATIPHKKLSDEKKILIDVKANRQPVAIHLAERDFDTHTIPVEKNDMLYIFSDGYADQPGGTDGRKFMTKKFKKLLLEISDNLVDEQHKYLHTIHEGWRNNNKQIDDILVIGICI